MYSLATVEPALGHRHGKTTSQCCFLPYYSLNRKLSYNLKIQQFSCRRPQHQFLCIVALSRHSVFPMQTPHDNSKSQHNTSSASNTKQTGGECWRGFLFWLPLTQSPCRFALLLQLHHPSCSTME